MELLTSSSVSISVTKLDYYLDSVFNTSVCTVCVSIAKAEEIAGVDIYTECKAPLT